jgi:hypothetical protein
MAGSSLASYRRQFRAWRNTRRLQGELKSAAARFAVGGLSIPGDDDIRAILSYRFPDSQPKPQGTLNIIAIYHHYNWENESLLPSLEKFGTVRHYDWFAEFNHQQERAWHYRVKADMNRALVALVERWHKEAAADVIFTYLSGALVTTGTMARIKSFGVPTVNLSLNDKEHFVGKIKNGQATGMRDICRYFDLCWTSTEDALKKYRIADALPLYLPEGANPEIHKPYAGARTIDVSFVGQKYGDRTEIIEGLQRAGIPVAAFGYGWPNGPLATEEMVRLYSKSHINLGFGGVSGHSQTYCLKGRDFEVPMSGGLYLTEHHEELSKVYQVGREIMTYRNFAELMDNIRHLLANPQKAEEIRQNGFQRARSEHSWEMRLGKIFKLMGVLA